MSAPSAFHDSGHFAFIATLENAFEAILADLKGLHSSDFVESPDSLTTISGRYYERGWRSFALVEETCWVEPNVRRCPATARACRAIPGLVNASFSLMQPGTHLHPHRGERSGVLRCHLPLVVPTGDVGLRSGADVRTWRTGRCLVFDDTFAHEAWNHGDGDRVVLIVTFERVAHP